MICQKGALGALFLWSLLEIILLEVVYILHGHTIQGVFEAHQIDLIIAADILAMLGGALERWLSVDAEAGFDIGDTLCDFIGDHLALTGGSHGVLF